jgi:hypothetical protein
MIGISWFKIQWWIRFFLENDVDDIVVFPYDDKSMVFLASKNALAVLGLLGSFDFVSYPCLEVH